MRILLSIALIFAVACTRKAADSDTVTINCTALKEVPAPAPKDVRYIALKIPNEALKLDAILKAKLFDNKLFVAGMRGSTLMCYDMQGNPTPVGHQGRGGEEYLQVSNFDIDENGFVHLVDGEGDNLIIYDKDLQFVSKTNLPFDIDDIKCLPGGKYLLALSGWNEGEIHDYQVVVCDSEFNIQSVEKYYDHSVVDNNIWIGWPSLTTFGDKVFYMRTPDENVWAFSAADGKCVEKYYLDLGSNAIPMQHRGNLEPLFNDQLANYKYFVNFCVITDKYIYGMLSDKNANKDYIINRKKGEIMLQPRTGENLSGDFITISGDMIIGEIKDIERYSRDFSVNIDSVSHVLTLRNIK